MGRMQTLEHSSSDIGRFAYFAYGSCMNLSSLSISLGCQVAGYFVGAAVLEGYRLVFNYPSMTEPFGCANIEVESGAAVEGALYQLPMSYLELLDRREGVSLGRYRRCPVEVRSSLSTRTNALCYRSLITLPRERAPSTQYQAMMIQGLLDAGVSERYRCDLVERLTQLTHLQRD